MGFFDPIDWNGNGKHDVFDDLIDFSIFQQVMKDTKEFHHDVVDFSPVDTFENAFDEFEDKDDEYDEDEYDEFDKEEQW